MSETRPADWFRSKELDAQGTRVVVLRTGEVQIWPMQSQHIESIGLSRSEFATMAQFVKWCWSDLDKRPKVE